MAKLKVLCIGDPHFKADNQIETDLMETQIRDLVIRERPDIVVVLGDTLHTNERLNLHIQKRAIGFFRTLKSVSPFLYVLIGNHDRPNNNVFLTDDHPFTSLKEWGPSVIVVDTPYQATHNGARLVFVPYVPTGRFEEALRVGGLEPPYSGVTCIFAHQEFRGCKMSSITSKDGDDYKLVYPMCISGHIHDYDELQPNLIYTGTPIQHTFGDRADKTLSIFTFSNFDTEVKIEHQRFRLQIQKKLFLKLTPTELLEFVLPENTKAKIKVTGEVTVIRELMKTDHVKKLLSQGVKIEECLVAKATPTIQPVEVKIRTSFQHRLSSSISSAPPDLIAAFRHLFPTASLPPLTSSGGSDAGK